MNTPITDALKLIASMPYKDFVKAGIDAFGIDSFKELAESMGKKQQHINYYLNNSKGGAMWAILQAIAQNKK